MANPHSTSTAPKKGGDKDKRLAKNRSGAYKGGDTTKKKGAPTNSHKKDTKTRKPDK